jgi:hypothetical protein
MMARRRLLPLALPVAVVLVLAIAWTLAAHCNYGGERDRVSAGDELCRRGTALGRPPIIDMDGTLVGNLSPRFLGASPNKRILSLRSTVLLTGEAN